MEFLIDYSNVHPVACFDILPRPFWPLHGQILMYVHTHFGIEPKYIGRKKIFSKTEYELIFLDTDFYLYLWCIC